MTNPPIPIGIAWYRREDYKKLKKIFTDGDDLPSTFEQWLQLAQAAYDRFKRQGHPVEKVYINLDTFPAWCIERSLNINANARTSFADEFIARKYADR